MKNLNRLDQVKLVNLPPSAAKSAELSRRADAALADLAAHARKSIATLDRFLANYEAKGGEK